MKTYYQTEDQVRNIYQERLDLKKQLIEVSNSYNQKMFEEKGVNLILSLRFLSVKLISAIKKWKDMLKRSMAAFTVGDALMGRHLGKVISTRE